MEALNDGLLLVDKQEGQSSHDVVKKVRAIIRSKKVGHAGTLDPFATGLLLILVGQGTKLSEFLMALPKTYEAVIQLGVETDTYDRTGKVVKETHGSGITEESVYTALNGFLGETYQTPPPFSALKIRGKRAYELARKGQKVELAPRKIRIDVIEPKQVSLPFVRIKLRCSSGTYVRSIAHDLGEKLGCGAHLCELRRTRIGEFRVEEGIVSSGLEKLEEEQLMKMLVPSAGALSNMASVEISRSLAAKVRSGYCPRIEEIGVEDMAVDLKHTFVKLVCGAQLVAIAGITESPGKSVQGMLRLKRVFL